MTLTSGRFISHEYDRMVVRFSMHDGTREVPCAISTSAMDDLERGPQVRPEQREAQFTRLRDRIDEAEAEHGFHIGVRLEIDLGGERLSHRDVA